MIRFDTRYRSADRLLEPPHRFRARLDQADVENPPATRAARGS